MKRGAKTKLSEDIIKEVVNLIKIGARLEDACEYVDISPRTLNRFLDKPYSYSEKMSNAEDLAKELKKAKHFAKIFHIKNIFKNAESDPKLSCWWLSRVYSKEFSDKISASIDVTQEIVSEIQIKIINNEDTTGSH